MPKRPVRLCDWRVFLFAVERADTKVAAPLRDLRLGTRQSMVFPLTSPTTFDPVQLRRVFFGMGEAHQDDRAHPGGSPQAIAFRMAANTLAIASRMIAEILNRSPRA